MKKMILVNLFIAKDMEHEGLYEVGGKAFIMKTLTPVKNFCFTGMTAPEAYRTAHEIFTKWTRFGAVIIHLQDGLEDIFNKERAVATGNSNRPALKEASNVFKLKHNFREKVNPLQ